MDLGSVVVIDRGGGCNLGLVVVDLDLDLLVAIWVCWWWIWVGGGESNYLWYCLVTKKLQENKNKNWENKNENLFGYRETVRKF